MKKIKNILIIMLILVEVIATYFMYKSGTNKEVVLDNVELKELTDNNSFAIYLDGNEYTSSTTWPESAAFQKAECQNEKGDIVTGVLTFNEEENKAYVKNITQTTYCYLYFKSCNGPVGTVLAGKDKVTECEVGGMYRYQGTDNVNNYICFGTTDQSTCTSNASKYMYRIIGVTPEGELKLIKDTALIAKKAPEWNYSDSTMRNSINGSDFLTNSDYLSKVWQDLIVSHNWLYGFTGKVSDSDLYNGNYMYEIESGQKEVTYNSSVETTSSSYTIKTTTKKWDTSVSDKVGLLYTHDYLFAYPGGNPGNINNLKTIWLSPKIPEFIITAQGTSNGPGTPGHMIYLWRDSLTIDYSNLDYLKYYLRGADFGLRPVFYLTSGVTFKTGTGTSTDPYIIDGIEEETYTANFHFGSKKNDTVTSTSVSWTATWTLPNANQYCFSHTNSSSSCYWASLPSSATTSYSGSMTLGVGNTTYYFFVRNAAGQIASDSDTVTVTDTAPTCSFNVTNSGVTLQHSNATSWYLSTSQTSNPNYGTGTATSELGDYTYYGYVKNSNGTTGTCKLEMYRATPHGCTESSSSTSGGGYTCQAVTYFCDGRATKYETPYSCNGSQGCNGCTGNVNCANPGVESQYGYTCCYATYSAGTTTYYCSNGSSCTTSGCCSSMFCGSDNCKSGYTTIDADTYTRYCYKTLS